MSYQKQVETVPGWMKEKVLRLATERNDIFEMRYGILGKLMESEPRRRLVQSLFELEYEATVLLRAELRLAPELEDLLPEFTAVLKTSVDGSTLSPRERAAIVIIQNDSVNAGFMELMEHDFNEYIRLKWLSLARLLKEAVDE